MIHRGYEIRCEAYSVPYVGVRTCYTAMGPNGQRKSCVNEVTAKHVIDRMIVSGKWSEVEARHEESA